MKIVFSALKRYVPLNVSAAECGDALVSLGFEVEGIENRGYDASGPVVVGRVAEKVPHPNADRLSVCRVEIGSIDSPTIVCGATNFSVGDRVPVALPGAVVGKRTLRKARMRGVESQGMMCSAEELGLSSDGEGLMILPKTCTIGDPVERLVPPRESILDLNATVNRGDGLSYVGIARELGALYRLPLVLPPTFPFESDLEDPSERLRSVAVEIDDSVLYSAWIVDGLQVGESSREMRRFLEYSGLRSVNNVVDVTNFVLLEYGQPLHAFDRDEISGICLRVRRAHNGEKFLALNGKTYVLDDSATVIADDARSLALAGIIGGQIGEITPKTSRIVLESAHFDARNIYCTSKALSLSTDSSYRFERYVDPSLVRTAARRALHLLDETQPSMRLRCVLLGGKEPPRSTTIAFNPLCVERVGGISIPDSIVQDALERLHFTVERNASPDWRVTVPSFRHDVHDAADLVEEVLRLRGTDKIPSAIPKACVANGEDTKIYLLRQKCSLLLGARGFDECVNDSFCAERTLRQFLPPEIVRSLCLDNPLTNNHSHLRISLLPGLLDTLAFNLRRGNFVEKLFECGDVFGVVDGAIVERFAVAFVVGFPQRKAWLLRTPADVFTVKSLAIDLLRQWGVTPGDIRCFPLSTNNSLWQEGYASTLRSNDDRGGEATFGFPSVNVLRSWLGNELCLAAECVWDPAQLMELEEPQFRSFSEYPSVRKDLSLMVDGDTTAEMVRDQVEKIVRETLVPPIQAGEVSIFDVYDRDGEKSIAVSMQFLCPDRSLTDAEVNAIFAKIQDDIPRETGHIVRRPPS